MEKGCAMSAWLTDAAAAVGLLIFIGGAFVLASAAPAIIGAL
jgi:hypothetical protein